MLPLMYLIQLAKEGTKLRWFYLMDTAIIQPVLTSFTMMSIRALMALENMDISIPTFLVLPEIRMKGWASLKLARWTDG